MPRKQFSVLVSNNPEELMALADNILQKHYQDGAATKIPAALADPLQSQLTIARTEYTRRNELDRLKEKLIEERNLLLGKNSVRNSYMEGTVSYYLAAARDILLGMYRQNPKALGDWGYTVNASSGVAQVVIPNKPDELITLAKLVAQKHYQDGANSPLNALDWDKLNQVLYEVEMKMQEARKVSREKELATQAYQLALGIDKTQSSKVTGTVKYLITSIRDVLLGSFRGREKELGNWGFKVNTGTSKSEEEAASSDPEE